MDLTFLGLVSWGVFLLLTGYFLPFIKNKSVARLAAWTLILLTVFVSVQITSHQSALYRMIAIVSLQLVSMKGIVLVETYKKAPQLNFLQWLCFAQGWFGMRPVLFEKLISKPLNNVSPLLVKGFTRIGIGFGLLLLGQYTRSQSNVPAFLTHLLMLAGLSFVLHFGILNLSTGFWRWLGADVKELFRSPYQAKSLQEFWGRRWNLAFSEMTALVVYRPLKDRYGKTQAMMASFLVSGILHEIAISFPVKAGYGLPLCYFVLHGLVMYAEGKVAFVKNIISHSILSHVWVLGWLVLPMPLLFHPAFIQQVVYPLINALLLFSE
jgi:alginate O-acetyltransferase complex protein AlgI